VPIYLRFGINGQRAETSTGKTCEPARWNAQAGRASGTKEEIRTLNAYLDSLQTQAQELFRNMQIREEVLTAEDVKNRFTGKEEKARTLVAVFEDHNQKMENLVGQEFKKSTLQRYKSCLMHVKDFLKSQLKLTDIPLTK
jgi:hypothetical protein